MKSEMLKIEHLSTVGAGLPVINKKFIYLFIDTNTRLRFKLINNSQSSNYPFLFKISSPLRNIFNCENYSEL